MSDCRTLRPPSLLDGTTARRFAIAFTGTIVETGTRVVLASIRRDGKRKASRRVFSRETRPGFQTPMFRHVPGETMSVQPAPRGRAFPAWYLTRQDDLVLLSITVIAHIISAVNARRCVRSLTDAYIRPGPDCR